MLTVLIEALQLYKDSRENAVPPPKSGVAA